MLRRCLLAVFAGLLMASAAPAQTAGWQFKWQPGQVLTYRVQHNMTTVETAGSNRDESSEKLTLTKRWQVLSVDAAGVATVQKTVVALRLETTMSNGEVKLFDSGNLDRSSPDMRQQLSKFVGTPLEMLRVDAKGKVVEVKESKYGSASRFESELPFVLSLPNDPPAAGQTWERSYAITLEPPQGTNERYPATQKYGCKALADGTATISLATSLQNQPEAVADRVPLLPMQPDGEVVFDMQNGRVQRTSLQIDKELKDYQGEGSSYRFTSSYTEELVPNQ